MASRSRSDRGSPCATGSAQRGALSPRRVEQVIGLVVVQVRVLDIRPMHRGVDFCERAMRHAMAGLKDNPFARFQGDKIA